ncbi:MAG: toll/interleukin-1 receptor domain-containing protein [Cyanobacteria bacterium J06656_5]
MADFDLFISYTEADKAWVKGYLLNSLDQAGVNYLSEENFTLGVPRLQEFERAIQQSQRTLLVLSPAYMADNVNQFIALLAQYFGLDASIWPVIPLLIKPVQLPPRLAALVKLDATEPGQWESSIARLCRDLDHNTPSQIRLPDCPYPGMLPFSEENSDRFFGREQEIEELLERLRLSRFITVIGSSGSGKSSLVLAGLIPALRQNNNFGNSTWFVRALRPGITPLETLKKTLETNDLSNSTQLVSQLLISHSESQRLLLIVDQFEELFTPSADTLVPSEIQDRLTFQQVLLNLIDIENCYIVVTVRADFYVDLMESPLWRSVKTHRMEITPLDEQGLRNAIVRPAEKAGVFVESALVERLVTDAAGEPGILPLIQETLVLLWNRVERRYLPLRAYEALVLSHKAYGAAATTLHKTGLQAAIARRADAAVGNLGGDQQETIARRIFLRLIQFGEGRADTRRQQSVESLCVSDENSHEFNQVLHHLVDNRLLTLSGQEGTECKVDIAHEALILGWPLLQQWIGERRDAEQIRRRLVAKAGEWIRLGKQEGGLLDAIELIETERWLESTDAKELGYDSVLTEFIEASDEWQDRRLNEKLELEYANKINQRLTETNQKADRIIRKGFISLGIIIPIALGASFVSIHSFRRLSIARAGVKLEQAGVSALRQFQSAEIDALLSALNAAQELKNLVEEDTPLQDYPATSPMLAIQKITGSIHEKNRFSIAQEEIKAADFSSAGDLVVTGDRRGKIQLRRLSGKLIKEFQAHDGGLLAGISAISLRS